MTPPHISPLFNHQKQSKVTFAIRCTNQKHLYLYTSATYALFSNILPEKACFLLRIFVSLHRQSKEQLFEPCSGLLLRPTWGINDGRRWSSMKTPKTAEKKPPMQKSTGSLRKQIIIILKRSTEYAAHHSIHHDAPTERPR